ncbi:hypothetical protein RQP53_12470 [Paucibacter sp. APW11]|uniref:PEP-CTERM protein-sorting domain-containing protein n=1 Tax=Roseateles aquae TaxID=3077235 RepID=A0ABU3PDB5_9BURK|nr:hypothetical protein [Paucibacter sp. APW11]MDT9000082.1 hypothetical protein [Paucibacter sp. APW11]
MSKGQRGNKEAKKPKQPPKPLLPPASPDRHEAPLPPRSRAMAASQSPHIRQPSGHVYRFSRARNGWGLTPPVLVLSTAMLFAGAAQAGLVLVGQNDSWKVKNPRNELATDMSLLTNGPALSCALSSGGAAFDSCSQGLANGLTFFVGTGANAGSGVAANGYYVITFSNLAAGTEISVDFSYGPHNVVDISLVTDYNYLGQFDPAFPPGPPGQDGLIHGLAEPPASALILLAMLGLAIPRKLGRRMENWWAARSEQRGMMP